MATIEEVEAKARAWEQARKARTKSNRIDYTARAKLSIAAGIHPVTKLPLLSNGEMCGSCGHLTAYQRAKRYLKCDLVNTRSEASDIRRWWPACIQWKAPDDV